MSENRPAVIPMERVSRTYHSGAIAFEALREIDLTIRSPARWSPSSARPAPASRP